MEQGTQRNTMVKAGLPSPPLPYLVGVLPTLGVPFRAGGVHSILELEQLS